MNKPPIDLVFLAVLIVGLLWIAYGVTHGTVTISAILCTILAVFGWTVTRVLRRDA